ncbi:MAG: GNAT family N-acetyltransferase [Anaerolineae bacterium]
MRIERGMELLSLQEPKSAVLLDGTQVIIRPIRAEDAPRLQSLFGRLSQESVYYRFLELRKELTSQEARCLADLDHEEQMALVASCQEYDEEVIGVARYAVIPGSQPREAEAAIVVEDRYQNRGLGALLLKRLTAYAVAQGIDAFVATIRNDNRRVLRLVKRSGLPAEFELDAGTLMLRVRLHPEVESGAIAPDREVDR